ncbi:neuronal acetylcholine receptor subunit alpha-10-like [Ptychodera flava]|uniref:neuronal acetylcholine receptor subunit alpha-10-like n=1 Tax=Ptychodera flava TaxID=63121 RepID=UPI003969D6A4
MLKYSCIDVCLLLFICFAGKNDSVNVTVSSMRSIQSVLLRDLLMEYNSLVRPVVDPATVLEVMHGMSINQIVQMDEINQQVTVAVHLRQSWNDEFLRWNPEDYGGITHTRIPRDLIWLPDINLYNSVDKDFGRTADSNVIVRHDGTVKWYAQALFTSSCTFDILYVPYDVQQCYMTFASWTYNTSLLFLKNGSTGAWLDSYYQNNQWELLDAPVQRAVHTLECCHFSVAELTYTLILRRQPFFHFIFIIIPFILMSGVSLLVFLLPAESGEKLALCITNLLTLIIFFDSIGASLPATSDAKFPLIGLYFFSSICMVVLSCVAAVTVLKMHHMKNEDKPVPRWLRRVVFGRFGLHCLVWHLVPRAKAKHNLCTTKVSACTPSDIAISTSRTTNHNIESFIFENGAFGGQETESLQDYAEDDDRFTLVAMQRDLAEILWRMRKQESERKAQVKLEDNCDANELDWKYVAVALDRFFFILFGMYFCANTASAFLNIYN